MFYYFHILVVLVGIGAVWNLSLFPSSCPEVQVMENFDIEKFGGRWYEVQRTFALVEGGLKCTTTLVSKTNKTVLGASFRRDGISILNRHITWMRGHLHAPDPTAPARLELVLGPLSVFLHYSVIDTDYDEFAVVWGCFESPRHSSRLGHTENLWILSRNKTLPDGLKQRIYKSLDEKNISHAGLVSTNFKNCTG